MTTTWADIQRLVSDLQRVQLIESAKKLSEANCVEVVSKLIRRSMIDVVFTKDGHSYITRNHLTTEVRNECAALGGRAALTEIAATLNVDLDHVESVARGLISTDNGFTISGGELFSEEYITNLQVELRSLLSEHGHLKLTFLCKHWNLSQELLRFLLLDHLSVDFYGVIDEDSIFTPKCLESHKNILRALLSAITKPLSINIIQARVGLPTGRFWWAFDALTGEGEVPGRLSGSRSSLGCTYIPKMHDDLIHMYVNNLLRQQEFIQMTVLKKLGLEGTGAKGGQLEQFLREGNGDFEVQALPSILISTALLQQCLTAVKEAVRESDVCDIKLALQSFSIPFEDMDFLMISEKVSASEKELCSSGSYVFSDRIVAKVVERLDGRIDAWAHELMGRLEQDRKGFQQPKKVEVDDWVDSKKGGGKKRGARGSGAKANRSGGVTREDTSSITIGVPSETLEKWVIMEGIVPEDIVLDIVERIGTQVDERIRARLVEIAANCRNSAAQSHKKNIAQLQEKAQSLYSFICMSETASASFPDALRADLCQFLLRTVGTEFANAALSCASGTENVAAMKEKQRDEMIASLPAKLRDTIGTLFNSLRGSDLDAFHSAVFSLSSPMALSFVLKQPDAKTRAEVLNKYVSELREQLLTHSEPAATLLSCVLFLLARNEKPVAASGRFVAQLVSQLEGVVDKSVFDLLVSCQRLVVQCMKNKEDEVARDMLTCEIEKLKQAVTE